MRGAVVVLATERRTPKPVDPSAKALGARLRLLREERGRSQEAVAAHLGLTPGAYQHYERGRSQPKMSDVPKLAEAIGCHPCDFFDDADVPSTRIADVVARELAEGWEELPEPERDLISGLVELRRRYRESQAFVAEEES